MKSTKQGNTEWALRVAEQFCAESAHRSATNANTSEASERLRALIARDSAEFLNTIALTFAQAAQAFASGPKPLHVRREDTGGAVLVTSDREHVSVRLDSTASEAVGVFVEQSIDGGRRHFRWVDHGGTLALNLDSQIVGPEDAARLVAEPFLRAICNLALL